MKLWYIYTLKYYSAIKRNTFVSVLVSWMDLGPIIQSEVSQKGRNKYCMCAVLSCSVLSNCLCPRRLQSTRILCPWGFSRQGYWIGLPCPPPGDLPNPGIKLRYPTLQVGSLLSQPLGKPKNTGMGQPIPSPGELSDPGVNPGSPALKADSPPAELPGKPSFWCIRANIRLMDKPLTQALQTRAEQD